ncbi:MAG: hypothetical protein KBT34_02615 [Prevotella sp.]|nr:hypothetical protein [Candidatus Prevotella equi]
MFNNSFKTMFLMLAMMLASAVSFAADSYTFGIGQQDVTATGSKIALCGAYPETITLKETSTAVSYGGSARSVMNGSAIVSAVGSAAANNRYGSSQTAVNSTYDDVFYFAYEVTVADGYIMDISNIAGNFFPADNRNAAYKLAIYSGTTKLYESKDVTFTANKISATSKSVAVSDLDASVQSKLKDITGTISVRMYWWQAGSSSYAALKDLNITASVRMAEGTRYSLSTAVNPSDAGSISTNPVGTSFLEGATVKMTATPTEWYSFANWTDANGSVVSTDANYSVVMDAAKSYTANFTAKPASTITYSIGESGAEGLVPEVAKYVAGTVVTVPKNQTLYVDGKTLVGWTDGAKTYVPGKTFTAGDTDVTLTPVFADNTIDLTQLKSRKVAIWQLGRGSGAPDLNYQGKTGVLVTQLSVSGVSQDMKLGIDATSGKLNNTSRSDALAQTNGGTKLYVPVIKNAVVAICISNGSSYNLTGTTIDGVEPTISGNVGTYTYTGEEAKTIEIVIGPSANYTEYISVTFPQTIESEGKGEIVDVKHGFDFVVGVDGDINAAITAINTKASGNDRYYVFVPDGTHKLLGNAPVSTSGAYETHIWNAGSDAAEKAAVEAETNSNNKVTVADASYATPASNFDNHMTHVKKANVSIIGQSKEKTILYNVPTMAGISYTSTLEIRSGSDNYLQDFTLKNMYAGGRHDKGVAVAFYDRGTRTIGKNIRMWSNQDTFTTNSTNGYYETCDIAGTVDFICGGDNMWFEKCNLIINNRGGNVITAPATSATAEWGYVFNNCVIDKDPNFNDQTGNGKFHLGRPWKNSPASTYINTTMKILPSDAAWTKMGADMVIRFHEYGSVDGGGKTVDLSKRNISACSPATGSDACVLTEAQASNYTIDNVFGDYDPTVYTTQVDAPVVSGESGSLTWADNEYALCWVIFDADGKYVANTTELSYTPAVKGTYTVRAANSRGGLGAASSPVEVDPTDVKTVAGAQAKATANGKFLAKNGVVIVSDTKQYNVGGAQMK